MKTLEFIKKGLITMLAILLLQLFQEGEASPLFQKDSSLIPPSSGWKIKFEGSRSSPIIAHNILYIGSLDGALYAFDSQTGRQIWSAQTGAGFESGPEIIPVPIDADVNNQIETGLSSQKNNKRKKELNAAPVFNNGTLYVGSEDFCGYAFNALTGERKWTIPTNAGINKEAVIDEATVFFLSDDGLLHAIDMETGQQSWDYETFPNAKTIKPYNFPTPSNATQPFLENGSIFITNWTRGEKFNTYFCSLGADSGITKWELSFEGWDVIDPIITAGVALIAFETRSTYPEKGFVKLYSIKTTTGEVQWNFQLQKNYGYKAIAASKGVAFLETEKTFYAFGITTGEILWQFELEPKTAGLLYNKSFHIDSLTYLINNGKLHVLDPLTGHEKWSFKISKNLWIEKVSNHVIYARDNKTIKAISATSGKEIWSFTTKTPISNKLLFHNNRIYFATNTTTYFGTNKRNQGYLFALDARTGKIKS